jgi:hypothetical protein
MGAMIVLEVAVYAAINEVSKNMPVYPLIRRYKRQKKKLRYRYLFWVLLLISVGVVLFFMMKL